MIQMTRPKYMIVTPPRALPKTLKLTCVRSGRTMSASPAKAEEARRIMENSRNIALKPFLKVI
jgi:hypothetical protein